MPRNQQWLTRKPESLRLNLMVDAIPLLQARIFQVFVNYLGKIGTPTARLLRRSPLQTQQNGDRRLKGLGLE